VKPQQTFNHPSKMMCGAFKTGTKTGTGKMPLVQWALLLRQYHSIMERY
jgi:hypothetical protein